MAGKKLFICDIDDFSKRDEGATKLTIELVRSTPGEKIVLARSPYRLAPSSPSEPDIRIVSIPFKERAIYHPLFVIEYLGFILTALITIARKKPDEVYLALFKYPCPMGQMFAFMLGILSKDFKQILYQKPEVNFLFKVFTRFKLGVISKETESWLKSKGFDAFYFPIGFQKPKKSYNKKELRRKYAFDKDSFVILHVGHAVVSRGMDVLSKLAEYVSDEDRILIVLSSWHESNKPEINKLLDNKKTVVIDRYIEDIYEIYALADVYVFPIKQATNAIDIPLSVLEARELDLPIIASDIDNMRELIREYGGEKVHFIKISTPEMMAREIHEVINGIKKDIANEK